MSPSYGLCLWQIPCWCEFSFSLVSLWGLPKKMSLTQQEPLRKDKIEGKISPKGEKKAGASRPFDARINHFPFCCIFFTTDRELFWIIFCLWHIPILGKRMIIWLWMGVENVLCHSHKAIQKQSIKPKGSEYEKVFWSSFKILCGSASLRLKYIAFAF